MQQIEDYYRYSLTIDNYKTLTEYQQQNLLVAFHGRQNTFRISRGRRRMSINNNNDDDASISQCMTKIKLIIDNENKTEKIAQEWSTFHYGSNFFSIHSNDDNLVANFERPWICSFVWTDNSRENLQITMSIKWHLTSIQICLLNNPLNDLLYNNNNNNTKNNNHLKYHLSSTHPTHTYHRLMHLVFETYYLDPCGSWSLIDNYSENILILYFNSSIIYDLRKGIFDHSILKNEIYQFKTFDMNIKMYNNLQSSFSLMISTFTSMELEQLPHCRNALDSNGNHYPDSVNMITASFITRIKTGVEACRFLNSNYKNILADYVHIPNDGIEIEFEKEFLQYQEIIEIVIEIEITDKLFDHMNIKHDICKYLAIHPEERIKFLQILSNKTRFNDNLIDYNQMANDPFIVSLLYVPEQQNTVDNDDDKQSEKIYATIGFPCTKADLFRIFDYSRYRRYNYDYTPHSLINIVNDKRPLELTINVKYKSFRFGTILNEHYKKVLKYESDYSLFDGIIDDRTFIHDPNVVYPPPTKKLRSTNNYHHQITDLPKVFRTPLIFHQKLKNEHYIMIDGEQIRFENINQLIVKRNNHLFRLNFGTDYIRKRKQPNSDIFLFIHYPDWKLIGNYIEPTKCDNVLLSDDDDDELKSSKEDNHHHSFTAIIGDNFDKQKQQHNLINDSMSVVDIVNKFNFT